MKITVKLKDIKIVVNDFDNNAVLKYESHNKQVQETIKVMCDNCIKLQQSV